MNAMSDELGLAKKGDRKYTDQVWAGLIDDPEALEAERQRRANPPPRPPETRRAAKREGVWIQLGPPA